MSAMDPADGLAGVTCVPCSADVPPLRGQELAARYQQLGAGWELVEESRLEKHFRFPDFSTALAFTNRVGAQAERLGHHPEIRLKWGRVTVTTWTREERRPHRRRLRARQGGRRGAVMRGTRP